MLEHYYIVGFRWKLLPFCTAVQWHNYSQAREEADYGCQAAVGKNLPQKRVNELKRQLPRFRLFSVCSLSEAKPKPNEGSRHWNVQTGDRGSAGIQVESRGFWHSYDAAAIHTFPTLCGWCPKAVCSSQLVSDQCLYRVDRGDDCSFPGESNSKPNDTTKSNCRSSSDHSHADQPV